MCLNTGFSNHVAANMLVKAKQAAYAGLTYRRMKITKPIDQYFMSFTYCSYAKPL
jgi:hypothetical protein